jgi:hypothetical protein
MAKKQKSVKKAIPKPKNWREADLIDIFKLNRISTRLTPLLEAWINVSPPLLDMVDQAIFDKLLVKGQIGIGGWSEEDLKMKFISVVLELGQMIDDGKVTGFFDKIISATVEGTVLVVKSDFMYAAGHLNLFKTPFFHFQEYKPELNPAGEPIAQLLEAFLIAQVKNQNQKPLYGVTIVGAYWKFVVMEGKDYCLSRSFEATQKGDLLAIIAILRKFRQILYENLYKPSE